MAKKIKPPTKVPAPKVSTMSLPEAMVEAASRSRQEKRYLYINLDDNGDAYIATKHEKNSSVFCYYNGGQVSMDDETSNVQTSNSNSNFKQLSTMAKSNVKSNVKAAPAKKEIKGVTVAGLLYKGKPVTIPAGRAKKWSALLTKLYGK